MTVIIIISKIAVSLLKDAGYTEEGDHKPFSTHNLPPIFANCVNNRSIREV